MSTKKKKTPKVKSAPVAEVIAHLKQSPSILKVLVSKFKISESTARYIATCEEARKVGIKVVGLHFTQARGRPSKIFGTRPVPADERTCKLADDPKKAKKPASKKPAKKPTSKKPASKAKKGAPVAPAAPKPEAPVAPPSVAPVTNA